MSDEDFEHQIRGLSEGDKAEMRKFRRRMRGEMSQEEIKEYDGWSDEEWELLKKKEKANKNNE